jgi:hypothetical protein
MNILTYNSDYMKYKHAFKKKYTHAFKKKYKHANGFSFHVTFELNLTCCLMIL